MQLVDFISIFFFSLRSLSVPFRSQLYQIHSFGLSIMFAARATRTKIDDCMYVRFAPVPSHIAAATANNCEVQKHKKRMKRKQNEI